VRRLQAPEKYRESRVGEGRLWTARGGGFGVWYGSHHDVIHPQAFQVIKKVESEMSLVGGTLGEFGMEVTMSVTTPIHKYFGQCMSKTFIIQKGNRGKCKVTSPLILVKPSSSSSPSSNTIIQAGSRMTIDSKASSLLTLGIVTRRDPPYFEDFDSLQCTRLPELLINHRHERHHKNNLLAREQSR